MCASAFCLVAGYLLDTNPSLAAQAGPDLVPNSIIQLGFAFLRPIDQTELVNMQLSQLAADLVTVQPSHVDTYTLVNSQSISESFTKTLTTTYTYANSWTSTSSLQNTFSTQVKSHPIPRASSYNHNVLIGKALKNPCAYRSSQIVEEAMQPLSMQRLL